MQNVTLISKELATVQFNDKIQDLIQRYIEYFTVMERMNKNMNLRSKLEDVEEDLKYCKSRGFTSEEITKIKKKVNQLKDLYEKSDDLLRTKKAFNVKLLFQNYKSAANGLSEETALLK